MVHGRITITKLVATTHINVHAGTGAVFGKEEPYAFRTDTGAIVLILESDQLNPHARGISTPGRIAGQTWRSATGLTLRPQLQTNK